jgi:hypothetical protein
MTAAFLLAAGLLLQAAPIEPKPMIDNARVSVWEGRPPAGSFAYDTVTVSAGGNVQFFKAGSLAVAEKMVVGVKPEKVAPLPNSTKYPLALPRAGAKKVLDNARVTVWDYTWTLGQPTPMHFHDKDVVVMFLEDGEVRSTTAKGEVTVSQYKPGSIRFNARDRVHTEELVRGKQRAIIVELK